MLSDGRRGDIVKLASRGASTALGALGFPLGPIGAGAAADKNRGWQSALGSLLGGATGATSGALSGGALANLRKSKNPLLAIRLMAALGGLGGGAAGAYIGHGPSKKHKRRKS